MTDQATKPRSAIALCCLNSAALLDLADQGIHEPKELERIRVHNHGQAQFLRVAADLADEMLAHLKAFSGNLTNIQIDLRTGVTKETVASRIERVLQSLDATIAKAEGRS